MANIEIPQFFKPREWQQKCFDMQKRFTVLAVHRRAGKTTLAVAELIAKALTTNNALYGYLAPELKQARLIAWDCLKQMVDSFSVVKTPDGKNCALMEIHETEPYIQFWNGSKIMLFGADKPDRMRGAKFAGVIVDEVAQMPKGIWSDILRPALMDTNGWALFIGTPKGLNLFSELYTYSDRFDEWASAKFTCYETNALPEKEIEAYKNEVSEEVFRREMLCDFTASASDQLISLYVANEATKKTSSLEQIQGAPLILGVDVARFGADRSVLFLRQGILSYPPIILNGVDLTVLALKICEVYRNKHPQYIIVDGTGVGGGVVDILQSFFGIFVYDVNFGAKSSKAEYANKRTEMWCRMADWLNHGGILPDDYMLAQELASPTYEVNSRGQKVLESKAKIKDRLGKSPDLADALALTFAESFCDEPVQNQRLRTNYNSCEDYSPYENFERQIKERHNFGNRYYNSYEFCGIR